MSSLNDPLLNGFNRPTYSCFWHHLMIHKNQPSDYKSGTIQKRVHQITQHLGQNSFSSPQGSLALTPTHVAAITGNSAGLSFLLQQKASLDERDENGKTASQYLREYHPELVPQFLPNDSLAIKDLTYNLNFINAISGFSPETQRYFYITAGAEVGDRLGGIIMYAFKEFLCSYQQDLDVFYVGHDPENPQDFKESMRWGNRLGSQFGVHCLSAAISTASHKEGN